MTELFSGNKTIQFSLNKINRHTNFQIYSGTKMYMFRAFSLPIIRSYPLYIWHWHMLYRFDDSLRARKLSSTCHVAALRTPAYHKNRIPYAVKISVLRS